MPEQFLSALIAAFMSFALLETSLSEPSWRVSCCVRRGGQLWQQDFVSQKMGA